MEKSSGAIAVHIPHAKHFPGAMVTFI